MKYFITFVLLTSIAFAIRGKGDKLILSDSKTLHTGQKIQLANSSNSPLYLHVFVYRDLGLMKHVNLTDEMKGDVMRIESFRLSEEDGLSGRLALLRKDGDDNIYLCEIEAALKTKEIKLLK